MPLFWVTGLAMIALALALASLEMEFGTAFVLAYIFLVAALVWSLGYWLTSDELRKRNPDTSKGSRRRQAGPKQQRNYLYWKWGVSGAIFILFIISIRWVSQVKYQIELASPHGWLIPDSEPTPSGGPCGPAPRDALMLFIGQWAVIARTFPHVLLRVDYTDIIVLYKKDGGLLDRLSAAFSGRRYLGSVALSMDVLSADQKLVARIDKNEITVNAHNSFRRKRPNRSGLIVEDENGKEVLKINYLNPYAIELEAVLNLPGVPKEAGPRVEFRGNEAKTCFLDGASIQIWSGTVRHP